MIIGRIPTLNKMCIGYIEFLSGIPMVPSYYISYYIHPGVSLLELLEKEIAPNAT